MTRRGLHLVAFFICCVNFTLPSEAATGLLHLRGATMGTTYSIKISGPPNGSEWAEETSLAIEAELRRVNDQMSTYLKTSELSRFNDSTSTDWFDVSFETATVVDFAMQVGEKSGNAFDVTVAPLVDRWSFGPGKRNRDVPTDTELDEIGKRIGRSHLAVRLDPPALKKDIPDLRVDLSAIAKGHGVDRIVELLAQRGAENVFVEIGGEVRVRGVKQTPAGPVAWNVGIQKPDAASNEIAVAYPMTNNAMATSGDYRNFFEFAGQRYSHTIDPVTRRPVQHNLASVTVIAPTCMAADAWATALNVLGPERAKRIAEMNELDTLLISRGVDRGATEELKSNQSNENQMNIMGTGMLSAIADQMQQATAMAQADVSTEGGFLQQMGPVLLLTFAGFAAVLMAMAIGVIFGRKSIAGSCGGLNARTDPDGVSRCSMCSSPSEGCEKLREKVDGR
jgi:thiamine biosynthesis lipoprotein